MSNKIGFLSQHELNQMQVDKAEQLKESKSRTRVYFDNEISNGGVTGILSLFFTKSAFLHGWESQENEYRDRENQLKPKGDPSNKIYSIAVTLGMAIGGAVGFVLGGPIGVGIGIAVGALLGAVEGYLENGKIKREITEGKSSAKKAVNEIKQNTQHEVQISKTNDLEKQLQKLQEKLDTREEKQSFVSNLSDSRATKQQQDKETGRA